MSEPNDRERKLAACFVHGVDDVAKLLADYREELTAPAKVLDEAERLLVDAAGDSGLRCVKWVSSPTVGVEVCNRRWIGEGYGSSLHKAWLDAMQQKANAARTAELAQDDADALAAMEGE